MQVNETALIASLCRDSFYIFVQEFWEVVVPEEPVWNWHIEYLCDQLQDLAERVFKGLPKKHDLIINISPGSTKSTICSVMFPAWVWARMPTARFICGSYAYMLSMDLSRKSRDVVQSDRYWAYFHEIELREDQNTKGYFLNNKGGMRFAVGTGGSVTGMHGHFIIVDDPLDPTQAVSEAELKAANRWMESTLPTRKVDKALTPTILIMQRLHQNDPTAAMLEKAQKNKKKEAAKHICLPARIGVENRKDVKPRSLVKKYKKGLMDPVRLSDEVLDEAKIALGEYSYAGQFGQRPIPPGGAMFKIENIRIRELDSKIVRTIRYWDKAATQDGGANSAGCKMGIDENGHFWWLDMRVGQWDSGRRELIIKRTAQMDGEGVIIGVEQEPGSGGKESAENTIKRLAGFRVFADRPTGDKVIRADPLSTQVNVGNVSMIPGEWNKDLLDELQYFPFSTFKDRVDSSSGAFSWLNKRKIFVGGLKHAPATH